MLFTLQNALPASFDDAYDAWENQVYAAYTDNTDTYRVLLNDLFKPFLLHENEKKTLVLDQFFSGTAEQNAIKQSTSCQTLPQTQVMFVIMQHVRQYTIRVCTCYI